MSAHSEIAFGLLSRAAQTAVTLAAAATVVWRLAPADQGWFWALGGMGALIQAGELGLTAVVLQTAAHLKTTGDAATLQRFWRSAKVLSAVLAPVAAAATLLSGFLLFGASEPGPSAWQGPWVVLVVALATTQALTPGIGYIEGAVSVVDSWRFQSRLEIASGATLILALLLGAGLWGLALQALVRLASVAAWLGSRRRQFPAATAEWFGAAEWRREIWPYQWKVAVSTVAGFLLYRAFTPIVLAGMGAAAAARFGLSLAVMGSWLSITTAWPASQIANLGSLASAAKAEELRAAFRFMFAGSTGFSAAGAAAILALLWAADRAGLPFAERSAGFAATALLLASAVIHHGAICVGVLLRSERRDPMLPYSIAGGLITVCALWYAAGTADLLNVALAYFLCSCLGIGMCVHAFRSHVSDWRYYLRPHRAAP